MHGELNERQKEAVLHREGPLLIIAGAGAGKTRVIAHRIFNLIQSGVAPESILAITFTNKAAQEMRNRVAHLLNFQFSITNFQMPWIGTFHSLGVHMLREHAGHAGLPRRFAIYDRGDSLRAMKQALQHAGFDPKNFEPGRVLAHISRAKGEGQTREQYETLKGSEYFPRVVSAVWREYEKILRDEKALDFDDLLLKTAVLLRNEGTVRQAYQARWLYLHIDEYQDTNTVQYEIAHTLAEGHRNIAVVGDVDQNIYTWRGASIRHLMDFERDWPEACVITLEENYRSTGTILSAANAVIEKNKHRREKTLFTRAGLGEKIAVVGTSDEAGEAGFVAEKSRGLIAAGTEPKEIAVLFRANFQSRALEEAFLSAEVPYQVVGIRFFERKEVKDMLSFVRAALDPNNTADFSRVINMPPRGIGKVTLLKILAGRENELTPAVRKKVADFRQLLARTREKLETGPLSGALLFILTESGLEKTLREGSEEDEERLLNIRELIAFASRYDGFSSIEAVERFLTDAVLQSDQDEIKEEVNRVRLMTVHAAKGLEFDRVFITGLEDGLFPHRRFFEEGQSREEAEEERRLFYVALTRARTKVFLSYAGMRSVFGSRQVTLPSEFIFDIPEALYEIESTPRTEFLA